jgi:uncharacterized protein (DUF983 family)
MIICPIFIHTEPEKCPECHKTEDIKEVCRHCGYEYKEDEGCFSIVVFIIVIVVILVFATWVIWTLSDWLCSSYPTTLLETLKSQWEWLRSIRIW